MSSFQSMEEGAGGMRFLLKLLASSATKASGVKLSGGRKDSMTEAASHTHLRPPNRGHVTHTPITVIQKGHAPAGERVSVIGSVIPASNRETCQLAGVAAAVGVFMQE